MIWHRGDLELPSLFGRPVADVKRPRMIVRGKRGYALNIQRNGCASSANLNEPGCGFVIRRMRSHVKSGSVSTVRD